MRLSIGRLASGLVFRFCSPLTMDFDGHPGLLVSTPKIAPNGQAVAIRPFCSSTPIASRFSRSPLLVLLLLLPLIAMRPDLARADQNSDAANLAVDLFIKAGKDLVGLPITDQEAAIVKQIVTCGVANQANVGDCAKNAVVAVVLQQAGVKDPAIVNAVGCLVSTGDPTVCASQALLTVAKLPPAAQPAVNCMLTGGNVADCGKKLAEGAVLDKIPPAIQAPAKCVMDGGNAQDCATKFVTQQVIGHLPPNMQGQATQVVACLNQPNVAGCVTSAVASGVAGPQVGSLVTCATQPNANVGKCAADFASANLPAIPGAPAGTDAAAKAIVACVGAADFGNCIKDPVITGARNVGTDVLNPAAREAIETAMRTVEKLKPDAPRTIDAGVRKENVATLQNIIMVADGIKRGDWATFVMGAGPELAIIASNVILSVFLTPAVADALGPAVAAMIHNDAAAAQLALQAIAKGDFVALAQVLFTWYETQFIDKPCALIGDNDVRNTVCGGLSDAIKFISDKGGDLAKELLGAGKDLLEWLGIWGTVDSFASGVWNRVTGLLNDVAHFFGIGGNDKKWKPAADCGSFSPKAYFANNYITCLPVAAQRPQASLNASISAMNNSCAAAFNRCIAPENRGSVASTCAAMGQSLSDLANQTSAAIGTAADLYTSTLGPAAYVSEVYKKAKDGGLAFGPDPKNGRPDFCSADFWNSAMQNGYADKCTSFVNQQFPRPAACTGIQSQRSGARTESACRFSLSASLEGSKAAGKDLVGPNSAFCKAQQKLIEENPCKLTGKPIVVPGSGQTFIDPTEMDCRLRPGFKTNPGGVATLPKPDDRKKSLQPGGTPKIYDEILQLPGGGGTLKKAPKVTSPGREVIDAAKKQPRSGNINSVMDSLSGAIGDRAINSVSGNSGYTAPQAGPSRQNPQTPRIIATPSVSGAPKGSGSPSGPSGGSGGASPSRPIPGPPTTMPGRPPSGVTAGTNTSRPIPRPPKSAPVFDGPIDYGGCAACGPKKEERLNVR
ncbi:MAG: hypothetical protein AB1490_11690 [Pseudomonadota bacterium]